MVDYLRIMAGMFTGTTALMLVWRGEYQNAMILIVGMLSFFVGEKNGQKKAKVSAEA